MRRIGVMVVAYGLTAAAHAAPCVTATPGCAEWVPLRGGPGRWKPGRSGTDLPVLLPLRPTFREGLRLDR